MLKLTDIYLTDEVSEKLLDKLGSYNEQHPDDQINVQQMAELFLDYGIRYLDISALE